MQIKKTITGDLWELSVAGRIDGEGANDLEREVIATMRAGAQTIHLNLLETTFLSSAGIRVLLQYWRQMKTSQRRLAVTQLSSGAALALDTTGFKDELLKQR